ncbi:MAG: EamA family transporter [Actinomycetota bacterium]
MPVLFGLAAALAYGAADFVGGFVSRRMSVIAVVLWSQLVGIALLGAMLPFFAGAPSAPALGWGAAAGIAGALGVLLLYRGLARGRMSVVAPITAVEAAAVPVVAGMLTGERPGAVASLGVGLALVAVALISSAGGNPALDRASTPDPEPGETSVAGRAPGVPEAFGAGLAFGAFFILVDRSGSATGLWPLIGTKLSSIALVGLLALGARPSLRAARPVRVPVAAAGVLDALANVFYLLAVRRGLLSLVAVLTSMYPAGTVLLARVVLAERIAPRQAIGFVLAGAAVVFIALG